MGDLSASDLQRFFAAVGARLTESAALYVLGGSALVLLGSPRRTLDLDFVGSDLPTAGQGGDELRALLEQVAAEMKIGIEPIPFTEFVPLPPDAATRHRRIGQFGKLAVYVFDPYSIALSKIERGFKTDIEDVVFMLRQNIVALPQLETVIAAALLRAREFALDTQQISAHLALVRKQVS